MAKLQPYRPKHDVPAPAILWELELTTTQVADLIGVCQPTVLKWCKHFGLPHAMRGAHCRITLRHLRAWLCLYLNGNDRAIGKLTPTARARIAAFIEGGR